MVSERRERRVSVYEEAPGFRLGPGGAARLRAAEDTGERGRRRGA